MIHGKKTATTRQREPYYQGIYKKICDLGSVYSNSIMIIHVKNTLFLCVHLHISEKSSTFAFDFGSSPVAKPNIYISRSRAVVARQAHNLKAVGSIPTPATNEFQPVSRLAFLFMSHENHAGPRLFFLLSSI